MYLLTVYKAPTRPPSPIASVDAGSSTAQLANAVRHLPVPRNKNGTVLNPERRRKARIKALGLERRKLKRTTSQPESSSESETNKPELGNEPDPTWEPKKKRHRTRASQKKRNEENRDTSRKGARKQLIRARGTNTASSAK